MILNTVPISNHHLLLKYKDIIKIIKNKYPNPRILISSLLPKKDTLDKKLSDLNKNLQQIVDEFPNTVLIKYNNIHKEDLHNRKHHLRRTSKLPTLTQHQIESQEQN